MEELIARLQDNPTDQDTQWALMRANRGLVFHIAIRYRDILERCPSVDLEDLAQAGFLALVPAALSYDAGRGKTWGAWAGWYINRAVKKELGFKFGTDRESGRQTETPPPVLVSLDGPISQDEPESGTLCDLIEDPDAISPQEAAERVNLSALVREKVAALPDRQAQIITAFDLDGQSMKSISEAWGVSLQRVSDLRQRGFKRLRCSCARLWRDYSPNYHKHKSVSAFQRSGSSVTEDLALRDL